MFKNFSAKDFAFIYFSNIKDVDCIYYNGAINLGKKSVKSFFSVIWPLYLAGRSSNNIYKKTEPKNSSVNRCHSF